MSSLFTCFLLNVQMRNRTAKLIIVIDFFASACRKIKDSVWKTCREKPDRDPQTSLQFLRSDSASGAAFVSPPATDAPQGNFAAQNDTWGISGSFRTATHTGNVWRNRELNPGFPSRYCNHIILLPSVVVGYDLALVISNTPEFPMAAPARGMDNNSPRFGYFSLPL